MEDDWGGPLWVGQGAGMYSWPFVFFDNGFWCIWVAWPLTVFHLPCAAFPSHYTHKHTHRGADILWVV